MSEFFAIRNVDERTKAFIVDYAKEKEISMAEALREVVFLVKEHLKEKKQQKKKPYRSFFEIYDKVSFECSDTNLSQNIDKVLYGKRD